MKILYEINGYYVSNEGTKSNPNFHVWIPCLTHSVCDSAYNDFSLAVCRCKYIATEKDATNKYKYYDTKNLYENGND